MLETILSESIVRALAARRPRGGLNMREEERIYRVQTLSRKCINRDVVIIGCHDPWALPVHWAVPRRGLCRGSRPGPPSFGRRPGHQGAEEGEIGEGWAWRRPT